VTTIVSDELIPLVIAAVALLMFSMVAAVDTNGLAVKLLKVVPFGLVNPTMVPVFEIPLIVVPAPLGVGPSKLVN
jgi:hypothetical protein